MLVVFLACEKYNVASCSSTRPPLQLKSVAFGDTTILHSAFFSPCNKTALCCGSRGLFLRSCIVFSCRGGCRDTQHTLAVFIKHHLQLLIGKTQLMDEPQVAGECFHLIRADGIGG